MTPAQAGEATARLTKSYFARGDVVTYQNNSVKIRAIVRTAHRDGTLTVEACHRLSPTGKAMGPYLGYKYRMHRGDLQGAAP